ncbi:MAG TPA: glycosyltransferase family 39 protein [Thermoanaerobaculia bacterium]|nr:glycosyltransferase family 39 protein [Thermoanaerobaculia bacterium]
MISGSPTAPRPTPRWIWLALVALLLWSGGLRVWMASSGLHSGHYWDERYSVKNLRSVLASGSLEPVNYYYPSLSYLPQAALLAAVEAGSGLVLDRPFSFFEGGRLHPSGYLLARLIQVACGLGSLVLAFLIGRRLLSAQAGLLAAFLLALSPQHVRLSTMWKPDVTLLFAILLALWWSLDALERPSPLRYVLAGTGVGLALAAKLNGGPIAAPLAVAAIVAGFRDRRHWWGLAAAAAASVLVFALLNPDVGSYLAALDRNRELYSGRASGPDPSPLGRLLGVAREEVGFVLSPNFHGRAIGAAALLGMAAVALQTVCRRDRESVLAAVAILVFPLAYTLLYALSTPYAKENNFLQILPFTALGAAFLVSGAGGWLAARAPSGLRLPAATAAAVLAVVAAAPTQAWVYRTQVPSTWEVAIASVAERLRPWDGRVAFLESPWRTLAGQPREKKALLRAVDDLSTVPPDLLDQADAELFPEDRLDQEASAFYHGRLGHPTAAIERFPPRWFAARGPTVVAVVHPREPAGSWTVEPTRLEDGALEIALPARVEGDLLSVELWRRRERTAADAPLVLAGERALRLHPRPAGRLTGWLTERIPATEAAPLSARLPATLEDEALPPVRVYAWR